jgi:peptidoglycan/LPS O-acetylase OafA/YrhL
MASHGVELFFVISGFVLALPFADRYLCGGPKVSLGRYLLRRVTRLEPPYLAALLLVLMLKLMASAEAPPMNELLPRLAASAGYVHGAIFGTPSPIIGPAWSLEIEVQFYLLMPGLAWVFLIRHRGLRRGIIVAAGVAIALVQPIRLDSLSGNPSMERHLLNYLQFFLAGILLADVYLVDWNRRPAAAWWGDIIWLVGWPLLAWLLVSDPGSTVGATFSLRRTFIGFPAIVFILYAAMFRARGARACMSIPVLTVIGGMCYSIYLVHNSLIFIAGVVLLTKFPRAFEGGYLTSLLWCSGAMIPTVLLGSTLFFVLIERPCMRRDWPQRLRDLIFVEVKETA